MDAMPLSPGWGELILRLALTVLAGFVIGLNRGEHGHPAGLRTTLLVALAAAVSMIQMNLLLGLTGKGPESFVNIDVMRLPLGILSGIGFIGGGAILRRGDAIHGVTTAATMWMTTVIGLCFGGGQMVLGSIATALGLLILWGLKHFEQHLSQEQRADLHIAADAQRPSVSLVTERLAQAGYKPTLQSLELEESGRRRLEFEIRWRDRTAAPKIPELLDELGDMAGIAAVKWMTRGAPPM